MLGGAEGVLGEESTQYPPRAPHSDPLKVPPSYEAVKSLFDLSNEPLPPPSKLPHRGLVKSNHFKVVHKENLVLYQHHITKITELAKPPQQEASNRASVPGNSEEVEDKAAIIGDSDKQQTAHSSQPAPKHSTWANLVATGPDHGHSKSVKPLASTTSSPGKSSTGKPSPSKPSPGGTASGGPDSNNAASDSPASNNPPGAGQGPESSASGDPQPGATTSAGNAVDLKARKKRRLIVLLLKQLNQEEKSATVVSNFTDQLISRNPIAAAASPGFVTVNYYDEDQAAASTPPLQYNIHIGTAETIEVGKLNQYLSGSQTLTAAGFASLDNVSRTREKVVNALNIIFSHHANSATNRWANAAPFRPRDVDPWRSAEPAVAAVGSKKFFPCHIQTSNDPDKALDLDVPGPNHSTSPPWSVPDGKHLAAEPGFLRSARALLHQNLLLNVNTTTSAFYHGVGLTQLKRLRWPDGQGDLKQLESFIKGLRVRTTYMIDNNVRDHERIYTITGLAGTYEFHTQERGEHKPYPWDLSNKNKRQQGPFPQYCSFPKEGVEVSVYDHFFKTYGIILAGDDLIVRTGGAKGSLLPMSKLMVLPGQAYKQKTQLVRNAQRDPYNNYREITQSAATLFGWTPDDQPTRFDGPFGVSLEVNARREATLIDVPADRLSQPSLAYRNNDLELTAVTDNPWNLEGRKAITPASAGSQSTWTLLPLRYGQGNDRRWSVERPENLDEFVRLFQIQLNAFGMTNVRFDPINGPRPNDTYANWPASTFSVHQRDIDANERDLSAKFQQVKQKRCLFVVVLLPDRNNDLYAAIKKVADVQTQLNVACCIRKRWKLPGRGNFTPQRITNDANVIGNMLMKINLKSSNEAVDRQLTDKPDLLTGKTMIVGMDVTHAGAGSQKGAPSIAAMVASHDEHFAQWPVSLKSNPRQQEQEEGQSREEFKAAQEKTVTLSTMLDERLACYRRHNNDELPEKIIFYRDGLSEGQMFDMCKNEEISQLRTSIRNVYEPGREPKIMVICAVKRHNTRFFGLRDRRSVLTNHNNGQLLPGVVVYKGVTNGNFQDFFLASQVAALGTCRPTHYVVLENDFGDQYNITDVARATYDLCYLFGRCSVSVGLVPAAYYADKACDRARFYVRRFYNTPKSNAQFNQASLPTFNASLGQLTDRMFYI
ncbi:hypothetical protein OHC33_006482 [Knufia fluminis]|uniref:Piwi domain-containing protein n=1 Tax=Knufia fluminis TaxID=191047 RepID=A0AAN8ECM5_9EURO|nr:hypothetical protein OHC33_006482 [Knufia fluminis]